MKNTILLVFILEVRFLKREEGSFCTREKGGNNQQKNEKEDFEKNHWYKNGLHYFVIDDILEFIDWKQTGRNLDHTVLKKLIIPMVNRNFLPLNSGRVLLSRQTQTF